MTALRFCGMAAIGGLIGWAAYGVFGFGPGYWICGAMCFAIGWLSGDWFPE